MKIEIARHERMSESGSSLLRLLQNTSTSSLDLLVRESLQNSLDAASAGSDVVGVNFKVGEFDAASFNAFFDGIKDKLNARYYGRKKYISVRDYNTSGLTGPMHFSEVKNNDFGNLLKLVYEISKAQENHGAGGSWGLGKTVYFRLGIGLVIYYSRIRKEDGQYESRLAAALVENERKADRLIPEIQGTPQRGIAWWGDRFDEYSTQPVTDEAAIKELLDVLGIRMYGGQQTGTTIIIPYVDEEELLKETMPPAKEDSEIPSWSRNEIEDYIAVAVQRWYAPRLENQDYDGQYLHCTVNGQLIDYENMAPVFQLIQKLYNASPKKETMFGSKKIISKSIELRNIFGNTSVAGFISYIKVNAADMKMDNPDNLMNPYYYIGRFNFNQVANDPIILFCRKPGMVVSYELTGDWTDGIPKSGKAEFIVGVFKANSANVIRQNGMTLEEYLRKSEKADHMSWGDLSEINFHPNIVSKIQGHVRRKITSDYGEISHGGVEHKNLGLGKRLADLLLPPTDYSTWDGGLGGQEGGGGSGGGPSGGRGGTSSPQSKKKKTALKAYGNPEFTKDEIRQHIQICFGEKTNVKIVAMVLTETGSVKCDSWESPNYIGSPFPVKVNKFLVDSIYVAGSRKSAHRNYKPAKEITVDTNIDDIDVKFTKSNKYCVQQGFALTAPSKNYVVEGTVCYSLDKVRGVLVLESD